MALTETEAAVLRAQFGVKRTCTPEALAERLGVTLGEVREAEKTALRKAAPDAAPDSPDYQQLTAVEYAVLTECLAPAERKATPEEVARELQITLGEVLEAIKSGMSKLEDPDHASRESLEALGVQGARPRGAKRS